MRGIFIVIKLWLHSDYMPSMYSIFVVTLDRCCLGNKILLERKNI